jgi:hypothetical protein
MSPFKVRTWKTPNENQTATNNQFLAAYMQPAGKHCTLSKAILEQILNFGKKVYVT